ncbi:hypothetical protein GUJ93_ZPchr0039g14221 [Zizania palustris]|uniref:Uncharacterized protein n=1 Tax=Zizania palustris TaxID=103762 RepID=A0A8J5UVJ6_ZIZPA|nr:hypothetical protein GUJ93_ZPchr0039g14221 [Zizania palustris]
MSLASVSSSSCLQPCTILVTGTGEAHEGFSFLHRWRLGAYGISTPAFFIGSAILQMDSSLQPSRISSSRWPMDARGVMATCLRHFPHSSAPDFGATSIRTGKLATSRAPFWSRLVHVGRKRLQASTTAQQ